MCGKAHMLHGNGKCNGNPKKNVPDNEFYHNHVI